MKKRVISCLIALVVIITSAAIRPTSAQVAARFDGLGRVTGWAGTFALGVSADGTVVVGYGSLPSGAPAAFRWSAAEGIQALDNNYYARQTSADGSVIVGQTLSPDSQLSGFRWTAQGGTEILPLYDGADVSADGNVVVSLALRWASGVVENLGGLGGGYTSAQGVSADGQTVVGWALTDIPGQFGNVNHAFRWTPTTGMQDLGTLRDGSESVAEAISGNGAVIVGQARNKDQFWHAFRWTAASGMVDLSTLGGPMSAAYGASRDGRVIVGTSLITSSSGSNRAFRWTTGKKMQDLRAELLAAGVTAVQNWILLTATDVSADGTTVVGYGLNPNKQYEAFRATLPN